LTVRGRQTPRALIARTTELHRPRRCHSALFTNYAHNWGAIHRCEVPPVRLPRILGFSDKPLAPQNADQQAQLGTQVFRLGVAKQPFKPQEEVFLGERMGRGMRAGLMHCDEPVC